MNPNQLAQVLSQVPEAQRKQVVAQVLSIQPIPPNPRVVDRMREDRLDGFLNQLFGRDRNSSLEL